MDLIEYGNKFTELDMLIRAVYGGTEKGIYIEDWGMPSYTIYADIPNWYAQSSDIAKPLKNSKGHVLNVAEIPIEFGDEYLYFGFWVDSDNKKYHVFGFEYR